MKQGLLLLLVATLWAPAAAAQESARALSAAFPHERHAKLFPLCESCHGGIATGSAATSYPPEASCQTCHNGTDAKVVQWRTPTRLAGLLRFSHPEHASKVGSEGRECGACHGTAGQPMMAVRLASAASCLTCHTHQASGHFADDNRCGSCHVALTSARSLSRERVAALPRPPSHERANFVGNHAPPTSVSALSCATCHARQSCARCHVNAATQPLIAALAPDDRVAAIVAGKSALYPTPADHRSDAFAWGHGGAAQENGARCATCHTRPSCTTCHTGTGGADVLRKMPNAERGGAPGVRLAQRRLLEPRGGGAPLSHAAQDTMKQGAVVRTVSVHDADFRSAHRAQVGAAALDCAGCHTQRFCSDCHTGEAGASRRFHAANFVASHASTAYGREADCASCHNTETSCRGCHMQSGLASNGRLDVAYHTAQPQWLLQHGRAARQGLQSCASCHTQRDCLACHATTGWSINPHGRGFDAAREAKRAPVTCLACHLSIPGARRTP